MSWQEALRRIDGDLAAGKLSKEQYALRREELLAEASSTTAEQPSQAPDQQETTPAPVPPPQPQVPAKDLLTTSRPMTAPSPADQQPTERMAYPKRKPLSRKAAPVRQAEVPPPVPAPRPAQQQPTRPQPIRQQPTQPMFEPARPAKPAPPKAPGGRPTAAFLVLGVVIALVVIGGGLWWLTSGGDENPQAGPPATSQPEEPPSSGPSELVDELPQLPGVLNRGSGTFAPDEGAKRKLYGDDEALLLKRQGVREVTWKGSSRRVGEATMAYVILVAENESAAKAKSTASVLRSLSRVPKVDGLPDYADLPTYRRLSEESNVYRVIYASGTKTVRVGVVQTPGVDEKQLTSELSDLLSQITAKLPAGGR